MQIIDHDIKKYDKYFITPDYKDCLSHEYYNKIENALKSGVQLLQFRSKNLSVTEYSKISKKIYNICVSYNVKYIVNTLLIRLITLIENNYFNLKFKL